MPRRFIPIANLSVCSDAAFSYIKQELLPFYLRKLSVASLMQIASITTFVFLSLSKIRVTW